MRSTLPFVLATLAVPLACGNASGSSENTGGSASALDSTPAPNIDVTTCVAIHETDANSSDRCSACCRSGSAAVGSSFIYYGQCTCARRRANDEGKDICAAATADGNTCTGCCKDHDYLLSGWVGADPAAGTIAQCGCGSLRDATVCAGSRGSEEACVGCCLHEGFFVTQYGSGSCICTAL